MGFKPLFGNLFTVPFSKLKYPDQKRSGCDTEEFGNKKKRIIEIKVINTSIKHNFCRTAVKKNTV